MQAIVAVSPEWGIGYGGELLYRIPEDLRRFSALTTGKVVVMGRKTLLSLPGSAPLKRRTNLVLSTDTSLSVEGALVFGSLEALLAHLTRYAAEDVFVIGGQAVYTLLLPYCQTAYVTKVSPSRPADCFFPDLDKLQGWTLGESSEPKSCDALSYSYLTYQNATVRTL